MRNSLLKLNGIFEIDVDLGTEEALVLYSPTRVDVQTMIKATTDIGFPSSVSTPRSKIDAQLQVQSRQFSNNR